MYMEPQQSYFLRLSVNYKQILPVLNTFDLLDPKTNFKPLFGIQKNITNSAKNILEQNCC